MGTATKAWLAIAWIGISLEGLWFCVVPLAMTGTIGLKDLSSILKLGLLLALWIGLVFGAISFRRAPALLPFIALANFVGCVVLKNLPWGGTLSDWLHLAYMHSMDVVILISSYFAFQQRRHEQNRSSLPDIPGL
jgi:hypothetical protein